MFKRIGILILVVVNAAALSLIQAQDPPRTSTGTPAAASPSTAGRASVRPGSERSRVIGANTLSELRSRIEEIVHQPALEPGFFAVKIVSLDTGDVIFQQDANKFVRPASNMKLYTVAAALDRLTPDYRFITSVYAKEKPDDGKVKGDLFVYGRGDPSIAARFNDGDYFKGINDLADRIVAAGVKRIKGNLVGDESYFNGAPIGSGWEWEDLTWSYGAQISALSINDNAIDLSVKPGDKPGAAALVTTGPPAASFITILNRAITSPRGSRSDLQIYRGLGANSLEISGSVPLGENGFSGSVAIPDPALAFVSMLHDALIKRGVKIDGRVRTVTARSGGSIVRSGPLLVGNPIVSGVNPTSNKADPASQLPPAPPVEIASLQSPPFSAVAAHTLKPSQNQYTEIILRTLGKATITDNRGPVLNPNEDDQDAGLQAVRMFLRQAGINENDVSLNDGSGLSRNDMITANATVQLLTFMAKHKYFAQFRDALPIAGVDGTLRSRMRGTAAEGNLRGKTGSLSSVASLSGYVTTAGGEHLVFSMMLNNFPDAAAVRRDSIDAIAILLASFNGKTQSGN